MNKHGRSSRDQPPLFNVKICWTSISPEQRSAMAAIAQQMGATPMLDLTSDTTHLIVGQIDTPKYKYAAKERPDIKVLKTSWIEAVRESWMTGDETDVAALEQEHRLPTFFGLRICVTGFEDYTERNGLQESITANGGSYHGDLTKAVTHLVAAEPKGKKYEYGQTWNIKTVSIEWVRDSLQRGMALDETLYHPSTAVEERGEGAVTRKQVALPDSVLGKRPRIDDLAQAPVDAGQRKLRRTASTRLESQTGNLWADIGGADRLPTPKSEPSESARVAHDRGESVRNASATNARPVEEPKNQTDGGFIQPSIYSGYYVWGFDDQKTNLLAAHLKSNGAHVYSHSEMTMSRPRSPIIFLVPHNEKEGNLEAMLETQEFSKGTDELATEIWLEKCLHSKSFVDSSVHPLYRPNAASPIQDLSQATICPTSFSGIDLLHFSKAVKCTGAVYDETLRRNTSILVCNDDAAVNSEKLRYALENHIPVVSVQWLWDCMKTKEYLKFNNYAISGSRQTQNSTQPIFFHPKNNPRPRSHDPKPLNTARSTAAPSRSRSQRRGQLDMSLEMKSEPDVSWSKEEVSMPCYDESMDQQESVEFFNQDETPDTYPLQELSQSKTNSPQKHGSASPTKPPPTKSKQDGHLSTRSVSTPCNNDPNPESIQALAQAPESHSNPSAANSNTLNTAIATLLAHQQKATLSRPSSAASEIKAAAIPRKHRPLGRAPSNGSTVLSRTNSRDVDHQGSAPSRVVEEDFDSASMQARAQEARLWQPSQALGYEDPEGAAVREKLMRRRGAGRVDGGGDGVWDEEDGMKRVEEIGRVTDARSSGVEEKIRRRGTRRK